MTPLLSIRQLEKTYPNGVRALKGISFDVQKGEFLVVIGLSGAGKSTLLRCLNHLHEPTGGSVFFEGLDVAHVRKEEIRQLRQRMGMIFQHFNLVPRYSVLSNVLMGRSGKISIWKSLFGLWSTEDRAKAFSALKRVGLSERSHSRADQLSGGQQQRVAIARAFAQDPDLLLADEPVSSLDPATCREILDYFRQANREQGMTVIANLHFLSLVREYASRVVALKDGEIVYDGSPHQIDEVWFRKIYGQNAKDLS